MKPQRLIRHPGLHARAGTGASIALGLALMVLMTGLAGCDFEWRPSISLAFSDADRAECPHTPSITIKTEHRMIVIHEIPLAGPITDIPEFHDCQRFIVRDVNGHEVYDSLYAIYASFRLESLQLRLDSLSQDTQYVGKTVAVPAASIYSYGGTYDRLGIAPGFNCLYMSRTGSDWSAAMVRMGPDNQNCPDPIVNPAGSSVAPLKVYRPPVVGFDPGDFPNVARWDWDPRDEEQYIGIKCGGEWCEVSSDGSGSSPDVTSPPGADNDVPNGPPSDNQRARVYRIKGWYDAQRLAVREGGKAVPSNTWGVIIPHPILGKQNSDADFSGWVHAATAIVDVDYDGALHLESGKKIKIYLCHGDPTSCGVPSPPPACSSTEANGMWWARISTPTWFFFSKSYYRCVVQRKPAGTSLPQIPGTARWRWLRGDETTWKRCTQGCCEVT